MAQRLDRTSSLRAWVCIPSRVEMSWMTSSLSSRLLSTVSKACAWLISLCISSSTSRVCWMYWSRRMLSLNFTGWNGAKSLSLMNELIEPLVASCSWMPSRTLLVQRVVAMTWSTARPTWLLNFWRSYDAIRAVSMKPSNSRTSSFLINELDTFESELMIDMREV